MMHKREFLRLAATAGLAIATPALRAQGAYPDRPITFVVPFAAGGGGDLTARLLAKALGEQMKQSIVVENRVGAGGNIGSAYVLRAKPDGYTLLNMSSSYPIQAAVSKIPYDPLRDMQPVALVSRNAVVIIVRADSPLRDAKDLQKAAKAQPGMLTYGSAGIGSIAHLGMEELGSQLEVQLKHVPYKGTSQALTDLMGGSIDTMLSTGIAAMGLIKTGKVRALGLASARRDPILPDVPTFAEQGWPGYQISEWKALAAPAGTPPEVVALLNRNLNQVLRSEPVMAKLREEGSEVVGGTPEEMLNQVKVDIQRWKAVAAKANVTIE
jgi:tripartite-type tricarboxylate transporter receptor subunit TctC